MDKSQTLQSSSPSERDFQNSAGNTTQGSPIS